MNTFSVIVLRCDPLLGCYTRLPVEFAAWVAESLTEDRLRFDLDPPAAARLAEPGQRVLVFGAQHPVAVQQVLENWEYEVALDPSLTLPERSYRPPVDKLLSLGEPKHGVLTMDCTGLGLGRDQVPELIRMALDEELHSGPSSSLIVWAPIHAWRALAALRAEEAIVPLLGLLARLDAEMDDWVATDLPDFYAVFGQSALPPLTAYLANPLHGEWARTTAADAIGHIGMAHPELRGECVGCLSAQLELFGEQHRDLNAFLVSYLLDLEAVEAAPLMERAFAADRVEESVCGDFEDVQIELGLKTEREHPPKFSLFGKFADHLPPSSEPDLFNEPFAPPAIDLPPVPYVAPPKTGRNDPCPCGSGKKFKKCCGR